MLRLNFLRKVLIALILGCCVAASLALVASQIEQRIFRHHAEMLVARLQSLELRKTSWQEAQLQLQPWKPEWQLDEKCNERRCSFKIVLAEFVFEHLSERNLFVRLDDYFRWRLKLSYNTGPFVRVESWLIRLYMRAGGHPARVIASVAMRDGVVWSKGISVWIETYARASDSTGSQAAEFSLFADIYSSSRFDYYGDRWITRQFVVHPNYAIGRPDGCEVCVMGWVKFTPYAAPEDVRRLMQLDLSCLTRWRPCVTQSDIMPAAWTQYLAERSRTENYGGATGCSPTMIEVLGRDSANIFTAQIVAYRENFYSKGYDKIVATVRLSEKLKGKTGWPAGETRDVSLLTGTPCSDANIKVGSRLIFFGGFDRSSQSENSLKNPWPVMRMTPENMELLRLGVEEDYNAADYPD